MRAWISCLLVPIAGACASTHAGLDEIARRGPFTVHARDVAVAERVLRELEDAAPKVLEAPTSGAPIPVEIWCVPVRARVGEGANLFAGTAEFGTLEGIDIEIGSDTAWERFVVGHELGHAWLASELRALPQILEEGLADECGERADPEAGAWRRMYHALQLTSWAGSGLRYQFQQGDAIEAGMLMAHGLPQNLPGLAGLLALDGDNYHEFARLGNMLLLYSAGYVLAHDLGPAKLRALCDRARAEQRSLVPPAWVLEAAGLAPQTGAEWGSGGERLLGEPERAALRQYVHGEGRFRIDD